MQNPPDPQLLRRTVLIVAALNFAYFFVEFLVALSAHSVALLADSVFAVERIPALAMQARSALQAAGIRNVTVLVGDGTLGWRPFAPYDAILVAAASPEVPLPLIDQLAPGGRLIIPIGDRKAQTLTLVQRTPEGVRTSTVADVRFVPLLGEFGFR